MSGVNHPPSPHSSLRPNSCPAMTPENPLLPPSLLASYLPPIGSSFFSIHQRQEAYDNMRNVKFRVHFLSFLMAEMFGSRLEKPVNLLSSFPAKHCTSFNIVIICLLQDKEVHRQSTAGSLLLSDSNVDFDPLILISLTITLKASRNYRPVCVFSLRDNV